MKRRELLGSLGAASLTSLAGCASFLGGNDDGKHWKTPTQPDPQIPQEGFKYEFRDTAGALGKLGENIPEEEVDWTTNGTQLERVNQEMERIPSNFNTLENTMTPEQWYQNFQANDAEGARESYISSKGGDADFDLNAVIQETRERFNPESSQDKAVDFTHALIASANQNLEIHSSGLAGTVIPQIAEHVHSQIEEANIPGYKLSGTMASEPSQNITSRGETTGLDHPIGVLQYRKNGEEQLKYAELTGAKGGHLFLEGIREPEESLYHIDLDHEDIPYSDEESPVMYDPSLYAAAGAYKKLRKMEGEGITPGAPDWAVHTTLTQLIDDSSYDDDFSTREHLYPGGWFGEAITSDKFGESFQEWMENPASDETASREQVEAVGRALTMAYKTLPDGSLGEEKDTYEGPEHGSLALAGTLENSEILHGTEQHYEEILGRPARSGYKQPTNWQENWNPSERNTSDDYVKQTILG